MARHGAEKHRPIKYRLTGARRVRALTLMVDVDETGIASAIVGVQNMTNRRYVFINLPEMRVEGITTHQVCMALLEAAGACTRDDEFRALVR